MQFGFMPGKGMTDVLFVVQEECKDKKKRLFNVFCGY